MTKLSFIFLVHAIFYLLFLVTLCFGQDDIYQGDSNDTCSLINGQSCLNGVCKYCALCVNSACVLSTSYTTTNDTSYTLSNNTNGFSFYNYYISRGQSDDGASCVPSSECYQYRQSNTTDPHLWENLICSSNCSLTSPNGSAPPVPIPLAGTPTTTSASNPTHVSDGKESSNHKHHHNGMNIRSGSPASIALTTVCIVISLCLIAWLARLVWKSKYGPLLCCCLKKEKGEVALPDTPPPSFHSAVMYSPQVMLMRSETNRSTDNIGEGENELLPGYHNQGPSPPKYEHAIVTQIRGFTLNDDQFASGSQQNAVWIPVYLSPVPNTTFPDSSQPPTLYSLGRLRAEGTLPYNAALFSSVPDWANTHIQHSSTGREDNNTPR